MNNKIRIINTCVLVAIITIAGKISSAQEVENDFQTRTSAELSFEPLKKLKLNLIPELRFDENFSLDKYLFEGETVYKPVKFLSLGATYRFEGNLRDNKDTEYFNRFAFSATAKKEFKRFESAFRLRYTNDADDETSNDDFLRYKASLNYNIRKSKITPFVGVEAFQRLSDTELYKMRYTAGADYKLFKKNYLGVSYKFDYYEKEYKNRHILSVGYKIKF
jgi:hypothetical protein